MEGGYTVTAVPPEMTESAIEFSSFDWSSLSLSNTSFDQLLCTSTPVPGSPVSPPMSPFNMSMLSDLDTSENPPSGGTQPHLTPERSQSEQCSNSAISHRVIQPHSQWSGFKIVGDNLDKTVKPRHMRSDHQNVSLHYFHSIAVKDRIDFSNLPDTPPAKLIYTFLEVCVAILAAYKYRQSNIT